VSFFRFAVLFAALAAFGASMAGESSGTSLAVLNGESGKTTRVPADRAGKPFYFDFINSIYLAPVRETLVYTEAEGVAVIKVESPSAGVFEYYGLESDRTGIAIIHRLVGKMRSEASVIENHRLTVGRKVLRLREIAEGVNRY